MAKKNLPYPAEKIGELLIEVDNEVAKKSDLNDFVKKESGRGLSTNDYTTAEKTKLAGIQEGAQKNTVTSVRGALQLNPQVGNVVISAADIGLGNANTRLTSLENNKLDKSEKGATNGVASLDENGRVPSSQLPSYVDDVIEVANYESLPTSGESGKIYITQSDNKTYRWSGNGYAEISASLALGETEQTAYSGAKGKKNAEDIAKLAKDLDETHLLASNAESAISEVVELSIPAIESDVANKATKSEAQGYATTAKNEANAYTDSEVEKLATVTPIASGKIVKLTFGWTVSTLISFNATTGHTKDLFYYATYGTGTSARTKYNFLHQSGSLKIYIDESNTGTILYLHNTTQAGTMSVNNLIPSTVSIEEVSAIPENATLIGDANTLATLSDVRTRLGKTEKAADSAKADYATSAGSATNASQLGGVELANIRQYVFGANDARTIPEGTDFDTLYGDENLGMWQMLTNIAYTNSPITNGAVMVVRLQGAFYAQLLFPYAGGKLYYRAQYWAPGLNWYQWRSLTTDDTVVPKSGGTFTGDITAPNIRGGVRDTLPSTANNRAFVYTAGTKAATAEPTADNAYVGSSSDRTVLSVPVKDGSNTALNVTNLRLPYNAAFFSDIATCPNSNQNIWYRNVKNNVAGAWKRFVLEDHNAEKWEISIAGNADSATKLATARKIWGQNFDGSGDVDGDMEVNGDVVIKGNVVIEGSVTSGASYQSNPLSTISEDEVPSVEQQLRSQISSLEERIAALEQLIAQNNG